MWYTSTTPNMEDEYPDWYLEAIKGAEGIREKDPIASQRLLAEATKALLVYHALNIKDSKGNPILGEEESTQLETLRRK